MLNKLRAVLFLILLTLCALAGCSTYVANSSQTEVETPLATESLENDVLLITQPGLAYQRVTGTLQIAFLDVGQGDCIYVSLPNGKSMLIDAGESSKAEDIIKYISENSVSGMIDYVVATHPHADHIGGMADIINAFEIGNIWMPDAVHTTKTFENLLDTIEANHLSIQIAEAGQTLFDYGNLKAVFAAPSGRDYANLNNHSAVVLLTYNDRQFLFMGDAERESETEILSTGFDISADVLKVGHHGSTTSSTQDFIAAVAPSYAVITCGLGNRYGHPNAQTLAALAEDNITVVRTDEDGTIVFVCDDDGNITFTTFTTEVQPRAPNTAPQETAAPISTQEMPTEGG